MAKFGKALVGSMGIALAAISPLAYFITKSGVIASDNPLRYFIGWTILAVFSMLSGMLILYQTVEE
jgi:hypothetical protein